MNTRLDILYREFETKNKNVFLANQLELDDKWGQPVWGVTLQIDLGERVRDQMEQYQRDLKTLESDNLLLLPREYQHISFNQVVFWNGEYQLGRKGTWSGIRETFLRQFMTLDNKFPSFEISFSKLIATAGAIIWCAEDANNELQALRNEFDKRLPFPKETTKKNNIIHTTVARYAKSLTNPEKVWEYVSAQKEQVKMTVREIVLREELVFPSLETNTISKINLIPVKPTGQ